MFSGFPFSAGSAAMRRTGEKPRPKAEGGAAQGDAARSESEPAAAAEGRVRFPRLSQGAGRLRSASSRSCAPRATSSRPRYDGADLVIVNTCGFIDAAVEESLDAIGEALAENGKVIVTGCLGAKGDIVRETHPRCSRSPARTPPRRDEGGARAPAQAARSVHRSRSAAGHQAHAEALRVPEDLRGLQPPLHLLHHPLDARRPRVPADRRGDAGSREPGEGGREGTARHLAGHQRLRRGREVPHRLLGRASR